MKKTIGIILIILLLAGAQLWVSYKSEWWIFPASLLVTAAVYGIVALLVWLFE